MARQYDAIIIGTGQSGPALAGRMSKEGLRVAIIERHLVGGTCVNVGCIPTKTLVGSARVAALARRAQEFGIVIDGDVRADMRQVKARKDSSTPAGNAAAAGEGVSDFELFEDYQAVKHWLETQRDSAAYREFQEWRAWRAYQACRAQEGSTAKSCAAQQ